MRSFVLYLDKNEHLIPIGSSVDTEHQKFRTHNEQLVESEHDQYMLTFNVVARIYSHNATEWNPLFSFFHVGGKLRLILDNSKRIDFIIKGVSPTTQSANTELAITAQDEVSYLWSKHNITQTYSTISNNVLTPKNIYDIAADLIQSNFIDAWSVTNKTIDVTLATKYITLDGVQNNPYQILIEACNTVGASLVVNYELKTLDFWQKNMKQHSGYRYHPDRNLDTYSAEYSGEETTTFLHVHGGEDASGRIINMIPALPAPLKSLVHENLQSAIIDDLPLQNITIDDILSCLCYDKSTDNIDIDAPYFQDVVNTYVNYSLVPIVSIVVDEKEYNAADNAFNIYGQDYLGSYVECRYIPENETEELSIKINILDLNSPEDELQVLDRNNTTITVKRSHFSLETFKNNFQTTLRNEMLTFARLCIQVPYLGQYLISFEPFKLHMTQYQLSLIDDLIYNKLFHYNLALQYYAYDYYNLSTKLNNMRAHVQKVLGDEYLAKCNAYQEIIKNESASDADKQAALNDIDVAKNKIKVFVQGNEYINLLISLGISTTEQINEDGSEYWAEMIKGQQSLIQSYEQEKYLLMQSTEGDSLSLQYYNNLIKNATLLSCDQIQLDEQGHCVPGLYVLIKQCVQSKINYQMLNNLPSIDDGLAHNYEAINLMIQENVFHSLYNACGQYIYENTYENSEELDPIALYNQALTYFVDLNRVRSSHSLTVLDIGMLDAIAIPRLEVGSVISVYNPDTPLAQQYAPFLELIDVAKYQYMNAQFLASHQYNTAQATKNINEAFQHYGNMITDLIQRYNEDHLSAPVYTWQELEQILFQDTLLVTGITRVLREPLKDSVTVEQSSRYKSILAKLIKSI